MKGITVKLAAVVLILSSFSLWPETLKVVTINVWSGLDYQGTFKMGEYETEQVREGRYWRLIDELKRLDADIIGLNEANKLPRYARRIARDLSMDYVYAVGMGGIKVGGFGLPTNFREGDVILAKKQYALRPLGRKRLSGKGVITNFFSFHFEEANQVLGAVIQVNSTEVYIFNTHTHAGPPGETWFMERLEAMQLSGEISVEELMVIREWLPQDVAWRDQEITALLSWVSEKAPSGAPVVLVGDFNALPDAREMGQVFRAGFLDTYAVRNPDHPGYTWNPETNLNISWYYGTPRGERTPQRVADWADDLLQKRLDYIFVTGLGEDQILESRVVFNQSTGGLHASDHFGVMSILRIE